MSTELKGLNKYKDATNYDDEQIALKEIALINVLTVHQTRSLIVNMGIYHNKKKKSTRVLKAHYVDQLSANLENLNDTEVEYLERLTVSLLKKIIKAINED